MNDMPNYIQGIYQSELGIRLKVIGIYFDDKGEPFITFKYTNNGMQCYHNIELSYFYKYFLVEYKYKKVK